MRHPVKELLDTRRYTKWMDDEMDVSHARMSRAPRPDDDDDPVHRLPDTCGEHPMLRLARRSTTRAMPGAFRTVDQPFAGPGRWTARRGGSEALGPRRRETEWWAADGRSPSLRGEPDRQGTGLEGT